MSIITLLIKHDIKVAFKRAGNLMNLIAFFVIAASIFPFAIGSDAEVLKLIGVGIIWVCVLLSSILAVPYIFEEDYEDGTLARLKLSGNMLELIMLAKIISHWLVNILPLIVIAPLLLFVFHSEEYAQKLAISMLVATPVISAIATVGAALTLGIKRGGGLVSILILPLYIPVLIFSAGSVFSAGFWPEIMVVFALFLFIMPVSIFAAAAAVNLALEDA